ncbi:MAG: hypothetical protein PHE09_08055 [Oscillospiraceae bacterium]|nr:hypothetical protein [Oscillospiraceae bacterium]
MTILLIIIVVILLIFLSGKIIEDLGGAIGFITAAVAHIIKGLVHLIKRLKPKKVPKKVIVYCPCSNSFQAEPKEEDGWIVQCPKCGKKLRVNTNQKESASSKAHETK